MGSAKGLTVVGCWNSPTRRHFKFQLNLHPETYNHVPANRHGVCVQEAPFEASCRPARMCWLPRVALWGPFWMLVKSQRSHREPQRSPTFLCLVEAAAGFENNVAPPEPKERLRGDGHASGLAWGGGDMSNMFFERMTLFIYNSLMEHRKQTKDTTRLRGLLSWNASLGFCFSLRLRKHVSQLARNSGMLVKQEICE